MINPNLSSPIQRFSSRRQRLDRSFLTQRLQDAQAYDRIAGYFSSSLLEIVGEQLESVSGPIRMVCNSDLHPRDVETAQAAKNALWRSWTRSEPEALLQGEGEALARDRFARLYEFLASKRLEVRVLPDPVFGMIHGKAGVITLADGSQTSFLGSANESRSGWQLNYELVWEDASPDAVAWVQEEFDALWGSSYARPLRWWCRTFSASPGGGCCGAWTIGSRMLAMMRWTRRRRSLRLQSIARKWGCGRTRSIL